LIPIANGGKVQNLITALLWAAVILTIFEMLAGIASKENCNSEVVVLWAGE
jgi:hypothetical protein